MRTRYYWNAKKETWSRFQSRPVGSSLYVIRDEMDAMVNHADGGTYTSKRAFTKAVRAAGCEIIGNESVDHITKEPQHRPREIGEDLKRAYEQRSR